MLRTVPALTALRALMIVSTPITDLPSEVCALATLEHLELRDNGKLTALPETLLGLTGLKTLELTQNAITELPAWLAKLPKLEQLIVKEPGVSEWPPELSKFRR